MALWGRIQALIAGGAVARAASDAVTPQLEPVRQHAWQRNQVRVLDPMAAARLRVQGLVTTAEAVEEASRSGLNENRLDALLALVQTAPSIGELDRMANRGTISREDFDAALAKHEIPPHWWGALWDLTRDKLDPAQVAAAIHRGLIPDPGLLKGEQPSGPRNVESYPVYPIDPIEEAASDGIDRERLGVLVGLQGLPMGPHEAAQALFRGIITRGDYIAAFNESNNRNEWAEAVLEQSRQIPTARDFFENALRGYHPFEWALEQAKRHGMSEADATVIYQNQGRPMNVRNITQALARGAKFNPEPGEIRDPFDAAIVEGNLKPGYYELAKALRYTLPSVFAIRQLATSGVWGYEKTRERLLWWGWIPEDAADVAKAWTGGNDTASDPHVGKAQTQLWTAIHSAYVKEEADDAEASDVLGKVGVAADSIQAVLDLWQTERTVVRKTLAPLDIKKAYLNTTMNYATGAAWTRVDAIDALVNLGYSEDEAADYLDIPLRG